MTTEKVYLLNGTLHRRTKSVRLQAVDAVEIDQSLVGQLFGYGTIEVGPLRSATSRTRARSAGSSSASPRKPKGRDTRRRPAP